jgi:cob(I)alamin adenosyltransferase
MTPPVSAPRAYDKKIRLLSGHNVDKDSVVVETIGVGDRRQAFLGDVGVAQETRRKTEQLIM